MSKNKWWDDMERMCPDFKGNEEPITIGDIEKALKDISGIFHAPAKELLEFTVDHAKMRFRFHTPDNEMSDKFGLSSMLHEK